MCSTTQICCFSGSRYRLERIGDREMSLGSTSHCKIGGPRGSLAPMDDLRLEDRAALEQANPPDYIHLDIIDG